MMGVVKEFGELTASDLVMFCWVEMTEDGKTKFMRGRRRTIDEGITLCGGDVKRYMNYANDYNKAGIL